MLLFLDLALDALDDLRSKMPALKRKRTRIYSAIRAPVPDHFAECCTTVWLFDLSVRFFGRYSGVNAPGCFACGLCLLAVDGGGC